MRFEMTTKLKGGASFDLRISSAGAGATGCGRARHENGIGGPA